MNDVIANDALLLAQDASNLARQVADLYLAIKNHRDKAVALGITFDGNTAGVPNSPDAASAEYQFTQFMSYMQQAGVFTVYLRAARIGGGPNQLG